MIDKYLNAMTGPNHGLKGWNRACGPVARLDWLEGGKLKDEVPDWFVEFFLSTREVAAVDYESESLGMSSLEENWVLYRLIGEAASTDSLEIGIMRGATCLTISRAIEDHKLACRQTALDIDPRAVEIVTRKLGRAAQAHAFEVVTADSKAWLPGQKEGWQFAFLDGDHAYHAIAFELVEVFNRMPLGGWIVMHDTGSALWHWYQEPGVLMFQALDREIGDAAELTWLDNTDQAQNTRMLFQLGLAPKIASATNAMFDGWGGLGIVRKVADRTLSHAQFAPYAPPQPPPPRKPSLARRVARKVRRMVAAPASGPRS
jgi:predicted O-methyltransferase YrrM